MCKINQKGDNGATLGLLCEISGKPIRIVNRHGVYCEDLCDMDKAIEAEQHLRDTLISFEDLSKKNK